MGMSDAQLTPEEAVRFDEARLWEKMNDHERALWQLRQERLCMPFSVFHAAVEAALGRPVFTHEFGLDGEGLITELLGLRARPSLTDVIELIPAEKRAVVILPKSGPAIV